MEGFTILNKVLCTELSEERLEGYEGVSEATHMCAGSARGRQNK